jgi:ElaB/YqjD/DUF883 family membrane-anchored ribosome-binding protein
MEAMRHGDTEKAMRDLGEAVHEAETALKSTASGSAEKVHELRARLIASIDKAKAVCAQLQEKTVKAAKATDKAVHEHPYQVVGMAFAIGLLVGVLATHGRHEAD